MNRSLILLVALTSALPVGVEIPSGSDSAATATSTSTSTASRAGTRLRVAGGAGYYLFVSRGCQGSVVDEVPARFREGSVSLEQRFESVPLAIGARGGWIRDRIDTSSSPRFPNVPVGQTIHNRYFNPYLEIDSPDGALGVGYVFHDEAFLTAGEGAREQQDRRLNDISFHARVGRLEDEYFLVQWMEGEPLASSGGYLTIGMGGGSPNGRLHLYTGLGAGGPYEGAGLMLRGSFLFAPGTRVLFGGRVGRSGRAAAHGASMGFEFNVPAGGRRP